MISFDSVFDIFETHAVLICTAIFWILMIVWGWHRGLMMKLLSFCSVAATLLIEIMVFPSIVSFADSNETVRELYLSIGRRLMEIGAGGLMPDFAVGATGGAAGASGLADIWNQTGPQSGGSLFSFSPLYEMLGLDTLAEEAGAAVGAIVMKVLLFVLIFIIVRIIAGLAAHLVRGLRKVSVLRGLDGIGGAIFGALEGLIYIWIFMLIVSVLPSSDFSLRVLEEISSDQLLLRLYSTNLIMYFILGMLS